MIKLLNLSTYDSDGGAGKAAMKLHLAMAACGVSSEFLTLIKESVGGVSICPAPNFVCRLWHAAARRFYTRPPRSADGLGGYSPPVKSFPFIHQHKLIEWADVIIIYWVWNGFLDPKSIAKIASTGKPIIWRLSDCIPFTGGCSYPDTCKQFEAKCHNCPTLEISKQAKVELDFNSREQAYSSFSFTVVAPSK